MIRTYEELSRLKTFEERYKYLRIGGAVGAETFGRERYLNQLLYQTPYWKKARQTVMLRDNACDLGVADRPIGGPVIVHHMNPITLEDIQEGRKEVYDPDFLICVSRTTHNAIHFGDDDLLAKEPVERKPGDTCPWR